LSALVVAACASPADSAAAQARAHEERFLLYGILDTFEFWDANDQTTGDWIAGTRSRLAALRTGGVSGGLDPGFARLYDGAIAAVEAYAVFVEQREGIESARQQQASRDSLQALLTGAVAAFESADQAERRGSSETTAGLAGLAGGIGSGIDEAARRADARNAQATAAIAAAQATFRTTLTTSLSDATAFARQLAEKHGWAPAEVGLGDGGTVAVRDIVRLRPRDPFARARLARLHDATVASRLAAAADFTTAADLVPDRQDYHGVRTAFLRDAALYHIAGAALQAPAFSAGPPPAIADAMTTVRRYRDADPEDASGTGRLLLARALAHTGQHAQALNEALAVREQFKQDANYQTLVARLTSLSGASEHTAGWIESAYRLGFTDVGRLRGHPDLAAFARERPDDFALLTTVQVSFQVLMDWMLHDLVVTNDSPFALTNVRAEVTVRRGAKVLSPVVSCATLASGSSCRINDIGTLAGDRYDEAGGVVSCDQCPGGVPARHLAPGISRE